MLEEKFKKYLDILNPEQRRAVELIDGPLMVLAGPGTGKTQLLSARVANILIKSDALPQNILCLTFTENGARNMRERLNSMIGASAYDVHISTYHSFGSEIIREYPEYFNEIDYETGQDSRLEKPIDDLTKAQIIAEIVGHLPYNDPLYSSQYYLKSVIETVSELKKYLVTPSKLVSLANENLTEIERISPQLQDVFGGQARMPKIKEALQVFSMLYKALGAETGNLCVQAYKELDIALESAQAENKTTALTKWKNSWLVKDVDDKWELAGREDSEKMLSLSNIYKKYQESLSKHSLYDFDDMIQRTIEAMEKHSDLLYNLQEKYQYILLDEFQDTNAAQFELVRLLTDNPVFEGRPNIMAVGDDDQAIYAFQGADVGNMLLFIQSFGSVPVINLTENYRSHHQIIHTAHGVAEQIESRLHHKLSGVSKSLNAASASLPENACIERHEFNSQASEYAWVAKTIAGLVKEGTAPSQIAVLSPKHAKLESLVPFLNHLEVPVAYEKRENILDTPLIKSLELLSRLCTSVAIKDNNLMNEMFPVVLGLEFWQLPTAEIWKTNWQLSKHDETRSWAEIALDNPALREPVLFLLKLGSDSATTPLEFMLDYFTGVEAVALDKDTFYICPLKEFYFSEKSEASGRLKYFESISHLSVIRSKLRDYQSAEDNMLVIADFNKLIEKYRIAEQPLINSHPVAQKESAVQLMTAYKAKGLEFEYVFLLSVHDDIWGKKARSNSNKISLPSNLKYIRYFGSGEDELRRLLFVAVTRAKHGLYLTSHAFTDGGKATEPVKYLMESADGDGSRHTHILPAGYDSVIKNDFLDVSPEAAVELLWQQRLNQLEPTLKSLLSDRLQTYRMSPTHLNTYIDLEYGGPQVYLLQTLLKFPGAPGPDGEFGNSIHGTLDWYQKLVTGGKIPAIEQTIAEFERQIKRRYIDPARMDEYTNRGRRVLKSYITANKTMLNDPAQSEVDFYPQNILLDGQARLTGKIDRLEIDEKAKTIKIVDFKTGQPAVKWESSVKYLKYRQQLYFYKLLIENSRKYKGYKVLSGRLEFVEPDKSGRPAEPLVIEYESKAETEMKKLILKVWQQIQSLELDDISGFSNDYKGSKEFINLLVGK